MLIGQTIHKPNDANGRYHTPWFPRQGDAATFAVDLLAVSWSSTSGTLQVWVQTKNSEDIDVDNDASLLPTSGGSFAAVTSVPANPATSRAVGLKELVRFRIKVDAASTTGWVHVRFLPPAWEQNGA